MSDIIGCIIFALVVALLLVAIIVATLVFIKDMLRRLRE